MGRKALMDWQALGVLALALLAVTGAAANSNTVSYQGVLRDAALLPVADGAYAMRFSIWDAATAGTKRWGDEDQSVTTRNGLFSVYLGSTLTLGTVFTNSAALWLQIEVDLGAGAGLEVYSPRVPLASVPYAQTAQHARSAWSVTGNAATGTDFIGTTNAQPWVVKTNNAERLRVQADGSVGIGVPAPGTKLEVGGVAENEAAFRIKDSANENQVFMVPKLGLGGYNPTTQSDDAGLFFKDASGLTIGPWSDTALAMRISATGNVGVGTGTPNASAKLDVASTTQGFAMPRMSSAERKAIVAPVAGLQVFDTTLNGFYYWNGSKWDCVSTPAGTVSYFAGGTAPAGWLECNGGLVSTTTFAELFAAIGTTYGSGSGTFRVPDLRGEFVRGWDHGRGLDSSRTLGSLQAQNWKSFTLWGQNYGGGGYLHERYMEKAVHPSYSADPPFFMGEWATPANGVKLKWDTDEIRPRNVALMACIKY